MDRYQKEFESKKEFFKESFSTISDLTDTSRKMHSTLLQFWLKEKAIDRERLLKLGAEFFRLSSKMKRLLKKVPVGEPENKGLEKNFLTGDGLLSLQSSFERRSE